MRNGVPFGPLEIEREKKRLKSRKHVRSQNFTERGSKKRGGENWGEQVLGVYGLERVSGIAGGGAF